jgi:putative transcriptional regulator
MGFELPDGESLSGMVLVAMPSLVDPNFCQTVVYLAEHGPSGALGLVMNRPLGRKLGEVVKAQDLPAGLGEVPVFSGGPVKPSGLLFARFQRGKHDEELRCQIVADPAEVTSAGIRAFAGYSGWGEGQLERELAENSWKVCRPHVALLELPVPIGLWTAFIGDDQRWRKVYDRLPKFTGWN